MRLPAPLAHSKGRSASSLPLQALMPDARFHHPPHVINARCADIIVLMDQRHETFHTLNEAGGRIWDLIGLGTSLIGIAEALESEYDAPRKQLEADVRRTVGELLSLQLIAAGLGAGVNATDRLVSAVDMRPARQRATLGRPSLLWCGVLLLWFKLLLRLRGPHGALLWSDHGIAAAYLSDAASVEAVRQVEYAVAVAAALYPGRARCLEQSLVLYHILRRSGVAARFRLGAQPIPFMAHAWVEYRGEPINDLAEHVKWFAPFEARAS